MSALQRRLRRIILLVALFGVATAIVGMFTGELIYREHPHELLRAPRAGGWPVVVAIAAVLGYAAWLWPNPRRGPTVGWSFFTFGALCCAAIASFHFDLFVTRVVLWPMQTMVFLGSVMLVLICPISLIVALVSDREPPEPEMPAARVVG